MAFFPAAEDHSQSFQRRQSSPGYYFLRQTVLRTAVRGKAHPSPHKRSRKEQNQTTGHIAGHQATAFSSTRPLPPPFITIPPVLDKGKEPSLENNKAANARTSLSILFAVVGQSLLHVNRLSLPKSGFSEILRMRHNQSSTKRGHNIMRVISIYSHVTYILFLLQGGALSFHLGGRRATVQSKSVSFRQNVVASSWFLPQKESLLSSFVTEKCRRGGRTKTALEGGYGRAPEYEWMESQFDIELSVMVPADTKSKDLMFRATSRTIELNLTTAEGTSIELLNSTRALKGPVLVDGTFWSFSDDDDVEEGQRKVTVTIEKWMMQPKDEFEHVEYDWGGVYSKEGPDAILEKRYDVAEELDVRDYASSMGVDIDNINMTMVDKEMFQKNVNMTRSTMDEMIKAGYVEEITRQADGQEFTTNEDGFATPFDPFGTSSDNPSSVSSSGGIPFIDTPSPWGGPQTDTSPPPPKYNDPATSVTESTAVVEPPVSQGDESLLNEEGQSVDEAAAVDPIGKLTVVRLKEILREQGLKVSGTKDELQERLRSHVNSMTSKRQDDDKESSLSP